MPRGADVPYYGDKKKDRVVTTWRCEKCNKLTASEKKPDTCVYCGHVRTNTSTEK